MRVRSQFSMKLIRPDSSFSITRISGLRKTSFGVSQAVLSFTICLGKRGGKFLVHLPEGTTRRSSGRVWRKVPDDILSYLGVSLILAHGVFRHHCFGLVSWRFPATSSKAHSSLSPNQLHDGVDLLRNSRPVGTEVLLQANSAKERDDQASEGIIIVTRSTRCS